MMQLIKLCVLLLFEFLSSLAVNRGIFSKIFLAEISYNSNITSSNLEELAWLVPKCSSCKCSGAEADLTWP